ncbi:Oidioi.mRNA.OKI2018_I69.chr1.g886.t1.cds [Oikopleura dioica]|uniref:Oidioi.mRNA.OKI2018_I69.PAR.g12202.t1.cds n=1 Tax=Oikopleura dioica TaxID=34765 RepID=A0ABN7RZ11_OIKDI|nr:Oidioi.mRNA.OKI2018_I69.PAR.g12202.t1.cds [Oikopleura dioica]CAG5103682.1 Oidioi.mRNA.OKI2018_I69.chr1.g886.t1.cds [Oikopleura dioica]
MLKGLVWDIQNSLNTNAAVPPKRIPCYGSTLAEKLTNLAAEATKIIAESQEVSNSIRKILQEADNEGLQGAQMLETFRTIAILAHSPSIGINRRLASTNKVDIENIQDTLEHTVRPLVSDLMRQVYEKSVYNSDEIAFWARMMEPLERDSISKPDLLKLEEGVAWILLRLWGEPAEAIFRMILAQCKPPEESNSRISPRLTMVAHIWNCRFKKMLGRPPAERRASFANERQLCATIANAIFGEIHFQLTNTRCIFPRLLSSAARSAWTHLNTIFGPANPLSLTLRNFLTNIDANQDYTAWDAIGTLRKLWPHRDAIPEAQYKTLNLNDIDNRLEKGLEDPSSLYGTTYEKLFWKIPIPRSYESTYPVAGPKRKRQKTEDEELEGNRGGNEDSRQ